ncbi:lysophospholipid acyltransferase family protein [Wenzhouxiangella marina]|nr:lysophospholipid acyltransferase family protein [Wenzhouxiangella marina]MBB6086432.1 1-acyl-sn-glycerol-3-phosphate acyltransferase [Wenzhouxiangella marina]
MSESVRSFSPMMALYPLWQWLVFVPVAVLATLVGASLAVPTALLVSPRLANIYIAVPWCHVLAFFAPVRVDVEGLEHVDRDQSYVVVANHQSQFDIPVIYGFCGLDLRWVMKAELGKVPFIAQGCQAIGHIFVDRSDPDQARSAINRAVGRLKQGTGILFFAEGTRSRSGQLLAFKKGAFRVAIDQQMPILPMTVVGTRDVMPADSIRIRPGRTRLVIHPPIETEGMGIEDLRALRDRVRTTIGSALEPLDGP